MRFYSLETIMRYDKVGLISNNDLDQRLFQGNCIAITNNGSVGCAYYQKVEFTCSHDVTPIYLKNKVLTEAIAMFLIPLLEQTGRSYSYGKKWRPKRMRTSQILLPTTEKGEPHWDYMNDFIRETSMHKRNEIVQYCKDRISELGEIKTLKKKLVIMYLVSTKYLLKFKEGKD